MHEEEPCYTHYFSLYLTVGAALGLLVGHAWCRSRRSNPEAPKRIRIFKLF